MAVTDCRYFSGYKPCSRNVNCDNSCPSFSRANPRILLVHLEAMGAVLRSTALLPAIKEKFPNSHITWVTKKPSDQLLAHLPAVDRVLTTTTEDLLALSALEFDIGLVVDKSLAAAGVLKQTKVDQVFGFRVDPKTGAILPASNAAVELWEIGLSDQKKFFENKKSEIQLACEALELPYRRGEYQAVLSPAEAKRASELRGQWAPKGEVIVGLNTGCAPVIPYKKLKVEFQREIVRRLLQMGVKVALLGGPEDTIRNREIGAGLDVIQTDTERGLRDGLTSMNAVDIVITGDSLGMHMAIALKKWTIAWFGPTCAHEIELYDRGVHVLTKANCSPCWKRTCDKNPMCYDQVNIDEILEAVKKGIRWQTSSTKPLSLEMSSSPHR